MRVKYCAASMTLGRFAVCGVITFPALSACYSSEVRPADFTATAVSQVEDESTGALQDDGDGGSPPPSIPTEPLDSGEHPFDVTVATQVPASTPHSDDLPQAELSPSDTGDTSRGNDVTTRHHTDAGGAKDAGSDASDAPEKGDLTSLGHPQDESDSVTSTELVTSTDSDTSSDSVAGGEPHTSAESVTGTDSASTDSDTSSDLITDSNTSAESTSAESTSAESTSAESTESDLITDSNTSAESTSTESTSTESITSGESFGRYVDAGVDVHDGGEAEGDSAPGDGAVGTVDTSASACGQECECPDGFTGTACEQTLYLDVTAGKKHTCGLLFDGSVRCWGNDQAGQVSQAPTARTFVGLQSGGMYSCGVREDRTVFCWGAPTSILDAPLAPVGSLVTGWDAACVQTLGGEFECWGNETKYAERPMEPVQALAIGWEQGCALLSDGSLTCWGANDQGQATPPPGANYTALSLASWHGCAKRIDDTVQCWGLVTNAPLAPVKSIDSRGLTTCVVLTDDSVQCWGAGGAREAPSGIAAIKVAVGDGHACALLVDHTIACWGDSTNGATAVPSE